MSFECPQSACFSLKAAYNSSKPYGQQLLTTQQQLLTLTTYNSSKPYAQHLPTTNYTWMSHSLIVLLIVLCLRLSTRHRGAN